MDDPSGNMVLSQQWLEPTLYGILIFAGLAFTLWGRTIVRTVIVLSASMTLAGLGAYLGFEVGTQPVLWAVGGFVLGGVLGGLLALFSFQLAVAFLGAVSAGLIILPHTIGFPAWVQFGALGILCGLAALLSIMVTDIMIRLGTALMGAYLLLSGVLYFLLGTQSYVVREVNQQTIIDSEPSILLLVLSIVGGVFGFLFQSKCYPFGDKKLLKR